MEQIAVFQVLHRHVWMIVALCVITTLAGYAFSFLLSRQYTASALVLVRPQQPVKMDTVKADKEFLDFPMSLSSSVETPSKTYIEIIKSPDLIGKVVEKLGFDRLRETNGSGASVPNPMRFVAGLIALLTYGGPLRDDPLTSAVREIQKSLELKTREDTYLFEISYTTKNAQLAADVSSITAEVFVNFMDELRQSETRNIRDQLQKQVEQSKKQLEAARGRLENFKKTHSVFLHEAEFEAKLKVLSELQVELAKSDEALVASQTTPSTISLAAKRARLLRSLHERETELAAAPEIEHELKQLETDVKIAVTAYEIVDKEFKQAELRSSYATPDVRLVSQPVAPDLPSSPARLRITSVALFIGLLAGSGLAFVMEYLDRRVRGIADLENIIGVKVLATISRVSRRRWSQAGL